MADSRSGDGAARIAVITVGRSDYGILRPVIRGLAAHSLLHPVVIAAGMHLSPRFGRTLDEILADGVAVDAEVPLPLDDDTPEGVAEAAAEATRGFARAFARLRPDVVLLLGDRFETHAAATAAVPFALPIAHLHGGELTEGAVDEQYRHAITKMSHLHFVAHESFAQRVMQMGEEPWRVLVSGAPALDNLVDFTPLSLNELAQRHGWEVTRPFAIVTYHPATLAPAHHAADIDAVIGALEALPLDLICTLPSADVGNRPVTEAVRALAARRPRTLVATSLGNRDYFSLMAHASVMIGNSSSGIIEAASFKLPVVNVGDRQLGRLRATNVIDVRASREAIVSAVTRAIDPSFRAALAVLRNPYGDGHAAGRIVDKLATTPVDDRLIRKRFHVR